MTGSSAFFSTRALDYSASFSGKTVIKTGFYDADKDWAIAFQRVGLASARDNSTDCDQLSSYAVGAYGAISVSSPCYCGTIKRGTYAFQ